MAERGFFEAPHQTKIRERVVQLITKVAINTAMRIFRPADGSNLCSADLRGLDPGNLFGRTNACCQRTMRALQFMHIWVVSPRRAFAQRGYRHRRHVSCSPSSCSCLSCLFFTFNCSCFLFSCFFILFRALFPSSSIETSTSPCYTRASKHSNARIPVALKD